MWSKQARRGARRGLLVLLLAWAAAGCQRPASEIVVEIESDMAAGTELAAFTLQVVMPCVASDQCRRDRILRPDDQISHEHPMAFGIVPQVERRTESEIEIEVTALVRNGASFSRRVRATFVSREVRHLRISLPRACTRTDEFADATRELCQRPSVLPFSEDARDAGAPLTAPPPALDLLLVVDNGDAMRENQALLMTQLDALIRSLTEPACTSPMNMAPHPCDGANAADHPVFRPVRDIHVGVVSTDLGSPGGVIPGCANADNGDEGLLNPIRYGRSLAAHLPWTQTQTASRPADCSRSDQFPAFLAFTAGPNATGAFAHDVRCNAVLNEGGCAIQQPLEAAWRALIHHDARAGAADAAAPNGGFLREQAALAIVVVSGEDDGSVRDCRFAHGAPCNDSTDVFQAASTRWSSPDVNLRFYMYAAGSEQDPTWTLDRYIDPRDVARGFLSLKPGHPERVLFAAITGVPLAIPMTGSSGRTDWNALLGTANATTPDDFTLRDGASAFTAMTADGPISMQPATADDLCPGRVVPACRREGSTPASCNPAERYFAWPARRLAEIARRFDESPLCDGQPCRNGWLSSICNSSYADTTDALVLRYREHDWLQELRAALLLR